MFPWLLACVKRKDPQNDFFLLCSRSLSLENSENPRLMGHLNHFVSNKIPPVLAKALSQEGTTVNGSKREVAEADKQ